MIDINERADEVGGVIGEGENRDSSEYWIGERHNNFAVDARMSHGINHRWFIQ